MQALILDWNKRANYDRTLLQAAKKLLEEASECHVAARQTDAGKNDCVMVVREAADVAILCFIIAGLIDCELEQAIVEKLNVLNRRIHEQRRRDIERGID